MNFMQRLKRFIIVFAITLLLIFIVLWFQITQPLFSLPQPPSLPHVDAQQLEHYVRVISKDYFPRDYTSVKNLQRLAEYIRQNFAAHGARTRIQSFVADGREYHNVIASFGPQGGERIIIGAHYDTAGDLPGADDNASGVAGLLMLARLLGQTRLTTGVDLVAFTLEEPPFFRS